MDWGLAKTTGDERDEGDEGKASGGTEGYMAPEQAAGEWVDARTDVFALGVILKQLIDGFPADKRLNAIVAKASAARADERYADAAQLGADVARLREGLPVEAWPEGVLDRVMRFTSRYRAPILLILTYIVIRVVIAAVFRR